MPRRPSRRLLAGRSPASPPRSAQLARVELAALAQIDAPTGELARRAAGLVPAAEDVDDGPELLVRVVRAFAESGGFSGAESLLELHPALPRYGDAACIARTAIGEAACENPGLAPRLPALLGWLRAWLTGSERERQEAVASRARRFLPSLQSGLPIWTDARPIDLAIAAPGLAGELVPVFRVLLAAVDRPDVAARARIGLWKAGAEPRGLKAKRK